MDAGLARSVGATGGRFHAMRSTLRFVRTAVVFLMAATLAWGCGLLQPATTVERGPSEDRRDAPSAPTQRTARAARSLPFVGRLVEGDRDELPPAVANALADQSPVTFTYREQLTHDEYHIPLIVSALDPVTYVGAPLGDFGVTAFATLTIRDGDAVLGDYTAKAYVSRPYTLYSSPTHRELEAAARAAVRDKIDEKLDHDADRLGQAVKQSAGVTDPPGLR